MKDLKYHIITFGCQMNVSDSERMSGVFEKNGMQLVQSEKEADVVVINACSVRQKAIDRIWGKLREFDKIKESRPEQPLYTVLTGCVLPTDRPKFFKKFDLLFPMKELPDLPQKLEQMFELESKKPTKLKNTKIIKPSVQELLSDKQISYASTPLTPNSQVPGSQEHYLQVKPKYSHKFSAFVPIMTGCNAFCTYCAVPFTRGREVSRKPEEIIDEVENLLAQDYKEITLLGQIINKYMMEVDETFFKYLDWKLSSHDVDIDTIPELHENVLREKKLFKFHHLLAVIANMAPEKKWWLRFTSSHPKWFSEDLIDTINRYETIVNHIHLPVQAGADTTLKRMLRPYTIQEYKEIVSYIRNNVPNVAITTDVIVGFCEETDEEFEQTKELFQWAKYDLAYIGQYSTRPGTKAQTEYEDNVPHETKVLREKELNNILERTGLENNKNYENTDVEVLVVSVKPNRITGRTATYKNVLIPNPNGNSQALLGDFAKVKITSAKPWVLEGELI